MSTDIYIEDYSQRSFVVKGDTTQYKNSLNELGGKYNHNLYGEPGWVFPKSKQEIVEIWIKNGNHSELKPDLSELNNKIDKIENMLSLVLKLVASKN